MISIRSACCGTSGSAVGRTSLPFQATGSSWRELVEGWGVEFAAVAGQQFRPAEIGDRDQPLLPKPKPVVKRGRRRPDLLVRVTKDLHAWFGAEPWRTGPELLERLQAAHPGAYPDALRTFQRLLKIWRHEAARAFVLGPSMYQHRTRPKRWIDEDAPRATAREHPRQATKLAGTALGRAVLKS